MEPIRSHTICPVPGALDPPFPPQLPPKSLKIDVNKCRLISSSNYRFYYIGCVFFNYSILIIIIRSIRFNTGCANVRL